MTPGLSDFYVSTTLRKRKPKQLSEARLDVREETVHEHFGMLSNVALKHGVDLKPHCIYNMDETGFSKDTNLQGKLILPVGRKYAATCSVFTNSHVTGGAHAISASGQVVPPMVIVKMCAHGHTRSS